MLKTVLFDLDDTLLDFTRSEAEALRRTLTEAGVPAGEDVLRRYHVINASQWELLEKGVLTREEVLVRRFDILFREFGVECSAEDICMQYEEYLKDGCWLLPGVPELLDALEPRYDLYVVSNGSARIQHARLDGSGLRPRFRGIFISEEVGADKPDAAFFDACFAAIPGFAKDTALIVGDSLTADILGGKSAGIRTCWFNPHGKSRRAGICPDLEVRALGELPGLLEKL